MSMPDSAKPWPPREGWGFFVWWLAGMLVFGVAYQATVFVNYSVRKTTADDTAMVFALVAVMAGWQAWLLFRRGWRLVVWIALPLVIESLILLSAAMTGGATDSLTSQLLTLLVWVFGARLLVGLRARPWLWALAGVASTIVQGAGGLLVQHSAVMELFQRLSTTWPLLSFEQLCIAAFSGLWILSEAASAYVLAFWMLPVLRENREGSLPAPSLQNDERT